MRTRLVSLALVLFAGCATVPLNPAARGMKVLKKDPPAECEELGAVKAYEWDLDAAKDGLRRKAYALGGNYVRWDLVEDEYRLTGTAFKCPVSATDSKPADATAAQQN